MTTKNTTASSGMGFTGWLTILFIGLKLTHFISWPWVWVLSPLWIGALFVISVLALILLFSLIVEFTK